MPITINHELLEDTPTGTVAELVTQVAAGDDETFYGLVETLVATGQVDPIDIEDTEKRPEQLVTLARKLQELYVGRSHISDTDGRRVTTFATRDETNTAVDVMIQVSERPNQPADVLIETQLQGQLPEPISFAVQIGQL